MRTLDDMIAARNAPIAPGADPQGFLLRDLSRGACRFPIGGGREGTRFCAMPAGDARSYCDFHRGYLRGQPKVLLEYRRPAHREASR